MSERDRHMKHIGEAIRGMLKQYRLSQKFDEQTLIASWEKLVGKPVARHTTRLSIRDKVLFVQLDSASMKNDLQYNRFRIVEAIEAEFGKGIIREVVLL